MDASNSLAMLVDSLIRIMAAMLTASCLCVLASASVCPCHQLPVRLQTASHGTQFVAAGGFPSSVRHMKAVLLKAPTAGVSEARWQGVGNLLKAIIAVLGAGAGVRLARWLRNQLVTLTLPRACDCVTLRNGRVSSSCCDVRWLA